MKDQVELPQQIKDAIRQLNENFWEDWNEIVANFPDCPEWDCLSLTTCRSAIISLIINYIIGFDVPVRKSELERLIHELRALEVYLRDQT